MSPKTVAPPPPPPPPPMDHNPMKPMGNGAVSNGTGGTKLILPQKVPQPTKKIPAMDDTRNDLLKAIRDGKLLSPYFRFGELIPVPNFSNFVEFIPFASFSIAGITLRKVEKIEQKEKERSTAFHDVASILARRVAIELSESEDSDSDEDSECWVEPTETSA